jgi:hypothetical protein
MGFTEKAVIPSDFNDVDSWHEAVTPCSHCTAFHAERPLKPKLRKLRSLHDGGLSLPYQCQSLWTVRPPDTETTKRKAVNAPDRSDNEPPVPVTTATINQVCPTAAASTVSTPGVFRGVIENLEKKLRAKYDEDLAKYREENANFEAFRAAAEEQTGVMVAEKEAYMLENGRLLSENLRLREEITGLNLANSTVVVMEAEKEAYMLENARIMEENTGLKLANSTVLQEVMEEKTRIRKQVVAVDSKLVRASARTYAESLEAMTKEHMRKGVNRRYQAELLASTVQKCYGGLCRKVLLDSFHYDIKKTNPYRNAMEVCRVLDMGSGQLNISGIDMLRKGIEGDENGKIEYGGGWMTSKYYLQQAQEKVHNVAAVEIPFQQIPTPDLDGVAFKNGDGDDYSKLLLFILEIFKLDVISQDTNQPPIQLAGTLDGMEMSRQVCVVIAGIKMLDPRAIDPVSHLPIGMEGSKKIQSRELCFPFKMVLTRDTKTLYQEQFKDFFDFLGRIRDFGLPEFGIRPIQVSSPQDMSSTWKALGRGGGCKVHTFFCYCCALASKDSAMPRKIRCESCITKDRLKCYHHATGDVATLERLSHDLEELQDTHQFLTGNTTELLSKLQTHLDPSQFEKGSDISNIEYAAESDLKKKEQYIQYLKPDLIELRLSLMGSHMERINRLRTALEIMTRKVELETTLRVTGKDAAALILLRQAVPCILHCENRCGEKIIKMFLLEVFNHHSGDVKSQDAFLLDFEEFVNFNVQGKLWRKGNWRLTTTTNSNKERTIGDQGMPNQHVRNFMEAFHDLIDRYLRYDEKKKADWKLCITEWRKVMAMARQREDFTDGEIDNFSDQCDLFFEAWVDLHGLPGMTNYFHMIGSGHMTYFLIEWRNLYRYSQQGWEALNSLIKNIYYRRTQRGGHKGDGSTKNSKLQPIAKWLQRRLFFISGKYKNIE